jgi:hypothetical protein
MSTESGFYAFFLGFGLVGALCIRLVYLGAPYAFYKVLHYLSKKNISEKIH